MHIVLVSDFPKDLNNVGGGVEAAVMYLSEALIEDPDLKLDVITLDKWSLGERAEQYGRITVYYLPTSKRPSRFSIMENIRCMRDKLLELAPDVIHVQIAGEYALAADQSGIPWVLTLHGIRYLEISLLKGVINRYREWFVKREEIKAVECATHVLSSSLFVEEVFKDHIRGKAHVVENLIGDAFFDVVRDPIPNRLLYAGRLIPRKDVMTILRAFSQVYKKFPDATLRLAGGSQFHNQPSEYDQTLKQYVAENGLKQAVTFMGQIEQDTLLEEYAKCSVFVLASTLETSPLVIMQAMAAGVPVVTTDAGGCRYLVEHGETGYVTPIGDHGALGDSILHILESEGAVESMGKKAAKQAEVRFRTSVVVAQTRALYEDALAEAEHRIPQKVAA